MNGHAIEPNEVLHGLSDLSSLPVEVVPPVECDRLDQRISELLALVDNAKIYAARAVNTGSKSQTHQMSRSINDAFLRLIEAKYELRIIR